MEALVEGCLSWQHGSCEERRHLRRERQSDIDCQLDYTYNAKNQTASIGGVTMEYTGALQTERVKKGSTSFTYSQLGMSSETTGTTTAYYVRDEQGQLTSETIGTASYYYLFDGQGNTAALTDDAGNVANTYTYEPYGRTVTKTGTVANPFEYGGAYGAYRESDTGLLKIGACYHDPLRGRWTQMDLLAGNLMSPVTLNRYAYAGCNPTNFIDPTGLACEWEMVKVALSIVIFELSATAGPAAIVGGLGFAMSYGDALDCLADDAGGWGDLWDQAWPW